MEAHRKQTIRWLVVAGLLVLAIGLVFLKSGGAGESGNDRRGSAERSAAPARSGISSAPASTKDEGSPVTEQDVARRIAEDAGFLAGEGDLPSRRERLEALRAHLLRVDSAAASAAIRGFLDSGKDSATGLPFRVGGEAALDSAPTLRVFLLDVLGSVDPPAALEISRRVMDEAASADEYAIALRNLAWNDSGGDLHGELRQRFGVMLAREDWRLDPADGFLEALDAGVLLGDEGAFASLLDLNRAAMDSGGSALSRACFIALDRMVEADTGLLEGFGRNREAANRLAPGQRASLWSRLDISRPAQREMLTAYLATAEGSEELDYFAAIYPNGNRFHVNRLFSAPNPVPSIAARMEVDRAVLRELGTIQVPAGSAGERALQTVRQRLAEALDQADAGK